MVVVVVVTMVVVVVVTMVVVVVVMMVVVVVVTMAVVVVEAVDLPPQSSTPTWGSPLHSSRSGAKDLQSVCTGTYARTYARTHARTTPKKTQGHAA